MQALTTAIEIDTQHILFLESIVLVTSCLWERQETKVPEVTLSLGTWVFKSKLPKAYSVFVNDSRVQS